MCCTDASFSSVLNKIPLPDWNEACAASIVKTLNGDPAGALPAMFNVAPDCNMNWLVATVPAMPPCRIAPEFTVKMVFGALTP